MNIIFENQIFNSDNIEILKNIPSESINLIVTDPPYGMNFKSNRQNYSNEVKVDREDYFQAIHGDDYLNCDWLPFAYNVLKNNSAIYIFCHWSKWNQLSFEVEKVGFQIKNMIVINKSNHGMGDLTGCYAPKHELLLYATKGRHILNKPTGRKNDVWNLPVKFTTSYKLHPNEKPLSWLEPCILESSNPGDIVLDPFCGSGSTLVCAKDSHRKYCGIEIDKSYYDIAVNRLDYVVQTDLFS